MLVETKITFFNTPRVGPVKTSFFSLAVESSHKGGVLFFLFSLRFPIAKINKECKSILFFVFIFSFGATHWVLVGEMATMSEVVLRSSCVT